MKSYRFTVTSEEGGQTLLAYLKSHLPLSAKSLKRAIDQKKCTINGRVEWFSTHPIRKGDNIEIVLEEKRTKEPVATLYEDEYFTIYNKPAGMVSESFPGILVHRLDKETSGALIVAKNPKVQELFYPLFQNRQVHKRYLAICDGQVALKKWRIDNYLGKKAAYQGGALYGKVAKEKGKHAVTDFTTLKIGEKETLVLAEPVTGRTHQIRVHLKEGGHPILGDWQYTKQFRSSYRPERTLLHALSLEFVHPVTHVPMKIEAPLFTDFLQAEGKLFG